MRDPALASVVFIIGVAFCPSLNHGQGHPIPPGVREADKQTNAPNRTACEIYGRTCGPYYTSARS